MSVPQRWNCVRRHKLCQVCIVQEDHGQFGQNCPLKTRLICKCGSERLHHKLLCSSNTSHPVASPDNHKGEDDSKDDKGAKRKSKRRNKKASPNSALTQISYENSDSLKTKKNPDLKIFSDRLLLLIHSLLSLADGSTSQVLRTKCKEHLQDEWLQQPLVLQSCMATVNMIDNKKSTIFDTIGLW